MRRAGAAMIAAVRAHAETTGDASVYALAMIPPPAARSPVPPPGRPYRPRTALLATGEVELSWKCDNPRGAGGTVYEVRRTLIPATPTTPTSAHAITEAFLGVTGVRRFVDATIPAGSATALYRVTAVRSTARGEPALFVVNLGVTRPDLHAPPPPPPPPRSTPPAPASARSPRTGAPWRCPRRRSRRSVPRSPSPSWPA